MQNPQCRNQRGTQITYLGFHLIFNLPLLLILALWPGQPWARPELLLPAATLLLLVVLFTSPWDNFAVRHRIWDFPPDRILGRLGYLPYEEYAFFIIQSLQVILLLCLLLPPGGRDSLGPVDFSQPTTFLPTALGAILWLAIGLRFGPQAWARPHLHYAWHLLFWFLPLILLQWAFAWPILLPRWDLIAIPTLAIGTWLSLADWIAVRQGIWFFDPRQITGLKFGQSLPWEEVAFFYLTSLLVAQSFLILLPEALR